MQRLFMLAVGGFLLTLSLARADPPNRTENVIVVTYDGFRWQEVFGGADAGLINKEFGGAVDPADLHARYWRDTPEERRAVVMPFFWSTLAKEGQIFGDASLGAPACVTNGLKFSYPGYNELFTGWADPQIDSNDKRHNPNQTVLEYLSLQREYAGRAAVFCTWDVFPFIFRAPTSGLHVQAGWTPLTEDALTPRQQHVNELVAQLPHYWPGNAFDVVTMLAAEEHLRKHQPRLLYIGLGETDEWGHARRYDLYLDAARNADRWLGNLWLTLQEMPQYQDRTTLILTTDHGRGSERTNWTDHGRDVEHAEFIWLAVLGPDTPPRGLRRDVESTQSQVAGTIARLLGQDWQAVTPQAAPPLDCFEAADQR